MINNNLFKWRMVFKLSATFVFTIIVLASCKKKDTSLGANSIDPDELLNSTQVETFAINTHTIKEDSVITSNAISALLGSYNDPKFGTYKAGFYTQFRLASENPTFGNLDDIKIDSFVLGLKYSGYYGDLLTQKFEVFQLTDSLGLNTSYYSFTDKSHSSTNLIVPSKENIKPDPFTQTLIDTTLVDPQLRIYLDTNLARTLITEASTNSTTYSSNDNFLNYFKGLYVGVNNGVQNSGNGTILYFNLDDPLSKLTVYYTIKSTGDKKTYDYLINTACANYNKVSINNNGTDVQNVINNHSLGQNQFYSQALKSRAVIDIPEILSLPEKAIIHEATLILPVEYQTGYKYGPGYEISIAVRLDNNTTTLYTIGVGTYDDINKQFTVDLRSYVQAIVSKQKYNVTVAGVNSDLLFKGAEIYVSPRLFNTSAERIVFNGSNTINKNKPKLILKYTEF